MFMLELAMNHSRCFSVVLSINEELLLPIYFVAGITIASSNSIPSFLSSEAQFYLGQQCIQMKRTFPSSH